MTRDSILQALAAADTLTAAEIAAVIGQHERATRKILLEMINTGKLRRLMSGWYQTGPYRYALPLAEPVRWYPWAQAGEYTWAVHTGSVPDDVRRLMAEV